MLIVPSNLECSDAEPKYTSGIIKYLFELYFLLNSNNIPSRIFLSVFNGRCGPCCSIDEKGKVISGDQLIAVLARDWFKTGRLSKKMVVSTVMANIGLERYLGNLGIELIRTPVGDRYVVEKMREHGCNLGGEQSGHILATDFATTGDGLIAGLQICSALANSQVRASEFLNVFQPIPQKTINVTFDVNVDPLKSDTIVKEIDKVQKEISKNGRLLVRKSGTEPVLRIMG